MKIDFSGRNIAAIGVAIAVMLCIFEPLSAAENDSGRSSARQGRTVNTMQMSRPIIIPATREELEERALGQPDRVPIGSLSGREEPPLNPAALNWSSLGPRPIENEFWSGDDDASGRISAIIIDPADADIVYLAGAQGGVWRSNDGGVTWAPLTDYLSSLASGALAFDPSNSNIIYYGTGEQHYSGDCQYGDGLFRSADGGSTWAKIALKSVVGSYISRVLVSASNPDIIHLGSNLGCLRSTDAGATWTVMLGQSDCNDLVCSPASPSVIFAAIHGSGVYKSSNNGANWSLLSNGLPSSGFYRINLAISQNIAGVIYASFVAYDGSLFGMYKTIDAGDYWWELGNTPNYLLHQGWYDNCLAVDPLDPDICYAGGVFPYNSETNYGIMMTTDGGISWADITIGQSGQVHPDQHYLAIGSDGALWAGCDGGIWKTTDQGTNWLDRNHDLGITQFYTQALHPTDPEFILGGTQDNGTVAFGGVQGWPQVNAGDGGPSAIEWDRPNIYYTTYVFLNPLYKWDNGVYQGDVTGPWAGERASWCNGPLVVDQNQPNTILAGTYRVYRSTDSGNSWTLLSGDLTAGGHLRSIAVANGASNTIYAGSSDGRVFVTTSGTLWYYRGSGLPFAPITKIVIDPNDWQNAYLCADQFTGGRVYHTTDGGLDWSNITGDLSDGLRGKSIAVYFGTTPPEMYLGTDYAVYTSTDGGTSWVKDSANMPNVEIYDMGIDTHNGYVVAATHGRGMFRSPVQSSEEIPTLSEWGMIILALMLLLAGTFFALKNRKESSTGVATSGID